GISTQHNPEFTMMEFYEAYADYHALMAMTEEMIATVAMEATGRNEVSFNGNQLSLKAPFARMSLREAAAQAAGTKLGRDVSGDELRDREAAASIARLFGIEFERADGAGKIATAIFERLCEEHLIQPTFVYDFPTEVSPLSKQKPGDPDTVERFELYAGGFEEAHAFSQLNDPAKQRRRYHAQHSNRARGHLDHHARA